MISLKKENKLLTINQLLTKELGVFMFKQISNANPTAFENMFIKNESNYKTRNKSIFIPKRCQSTICQQTIAYRAPANWMGIPCSIKEKKLSVSAFSSYLTSYLLNK